MGLTLLGLAGNVTFDTSPGADAVLGADVAISPATPSPLLLDIDMLAEVGQQYQPRGQVVQRPYVRVVIDEFTPLSAINMNDMVGPFSIERTLKEGTQWNLSVAIGAEQPGTLSLAGNTPANKMPVELAMKAPPPALAKVHVYGGYWLTDGTAFEQLLMSDGIAASSNRKYNPEGHFMEINGLGPEGRWDRALASLNLDPDHDLSHGDLIELLGLYVGIPAADLAVSGAGAPRKKAVGICRENWWSVAHEIAEAAVLVPYWDRDGILTMSSLFGDQSGASPEFVFTSLDILADVGLDIQSEADVPTCVVVQGTQPAGGGFDGILTKATFVETFNNYAIPRASHNQSSSGAVSTTGVNSPSPRFQLVSRVSTIDEIKNGCLVVRNSFVEGYYNPQVWKFKQDAAGAIDTGAGISNVGELFLEDSEDGLTAPVAFDSTPLRRWLNYKWTELSGERLSFPRWTEDSGIYDIGSGPVGYKEAELSAKRGWKITEESLQTRSAPNTDTWEVTVYENGQRILGDGRGVVSAGENYCKGPSFLSNSLNYALTGVVPPKSFWIPDAGEGGNFTFVDVSVKRFIVDACGFILRESSYESFASEKPGVSPGSTQYRFKDGAVSLIDQKGRRWKGTETDYVAIGEASRRLISTKYEDGQVQEIVVTDEDGYLPAAEACGLDQEDEVQDIEAKICSLEDAHEPYEEVTSNDFVESIEEARALGAALLRDAQAVAISFSLSAVWALEPGMKVQVYVPDAKISHECIVDRVRWYRTNPGGPILTNVVGKILVS